jgi:hypothetical protein
VILRYPNGATRQALWPVILLLAGSRPGELKHLSTWRKRNQVEIPQVEAIERGRAQTMARAPWGCGATVGRSPPKHSWEPKRPGTAHGTR